MENKEYKEAAERIASRLDGRTVSSHEHYREMLTKELLFEMRKLEEKAKLEVVEEIETILKNRRLTYTVDEVCSSLKSKYTN